jgi:hypothetical protein
MNNLTLPVKPFRDVSVILYWVLPGRDTVLLGGVTLMLKSGVGVTVTAGVLVLVGVAVLVRVAVAVGVPHAVTIDPTILNIWSGAPASPTQNVLLSQLLQPFPNPPPGLRQAAGLLAVTVLSVHSHAPLGEAFITAWTETK